MKAYYMLIITITLSITLLSCQGPQGDADPVGPQGATGENGKNGSDGESAYTAFYLIESNDKVTKKDNSWTDYLVTQIEVEKDSSYIEIKLDLSSTGVIDTPEIAFRAKAGSSYSNPTLMKWVTWNAIEKPSFTFLLQNISKGTYTAGIQWNALRGGITTSEFQQENSYNRVIITVY